MHSSLDEVTDSDSFNGDALIGPSEDQMTAFIARRDPIGELSTEPDLAIRAGQWLRGAEQAFLTGFGPLAPMLARHRDGRLVQWGVWLEGGYLTLARAQSRTPPPEVVQLPDRKVHLGFYHRAMTSRFPTTDLGRWRTARQALREQLATALQRKIVPAPVNSLLAQERLYRLATFVHDRGTSRRRRPIDVGQLRETVAAWMVQVNESVHSTWSGTGEYVDSDDIRWLSAQLGREGRTILPRPWPDGDRQGQGRYAFEAYSPELTLSVATDIVREALIGYRQLVEHTFPAFGDALGLYSILPVRVEGIVERPDSTSDGYMSRLLLRLHPDPRSVKPAVTAVDLRIVTDRDHETLWEFAQRDQQIPARAFGPNLLQSLDLPLHHALPVTTLAYGWLVKDLSAVGWIDRHLRID